MQFDPNVLKAEALKVVGKFQCSKDCSAGGVGAAVRCSPPQARYLPAFASIPLAALDSAQNTLQ
jgi:hypothetical protein